MPAKGFMKYVSTRTATAIKLPDYRPAPSNDAHAVDLRPDLTDAT
jgi:hypothetical protein